MKTLKRRVKWTVKRRRRQQNKNQEDRRSERGQATDNW